MATYRVEALVALADPTRRAIVEALPPGSRSVGELAAEVGVSSSAVSQHMRVLREARLVMARIQGSRNVYSLDPRGLADARDYLEQFWPAALTAYAAAVSDAREQR